MLLGVLLIHELIHLLFIKLFNKKINSIKINLLGGKVSYVNDNRHFHILIISAAPNLIIPIVGFLLLQLNQGVYFDILSIICIFNCINLLPFTADGSAILYCVLKILKKV
ncbi:metalloprotease family protein [Bacillus halotolerans]|uniref:metalloprotease family protein n=1 Tax=Bacillus halotolerans TaxID=260554 RepID=UPI00398A824F